MRLLFLAVLLLAAGRAAADTLACRLAGVRPGGVLLCDVPVLDTTLHARPVAMVIVDRDKDGRAAPRLLDGAAEVYGLPCERTMVLALDERIEREMQRPAAFTPLGARDAAGSWLGVIATENGRLADLLVGDGLMRPADPPDLVGPPRPWCREWEAPESNPWCGR